MIRKKISHWIPIIFLSSNDSEDYLSKGIDCGGDDYLTKPVNEVILNAKIRAMARIALMQSELDDVNQQLAILTNIDPLTQVMNRRGLEEFMTKSWQINYRQRAELSLLMIDIDFFKPYNDNYGHMQGDKCLQEFAKLLLKSINRASDAVVRFGGEEFIIILPFTPISGARFKAQEIIALLKSAAIKHDFSSVAPFITASIGISSTSLHAKDHDELIKQADSALYLAKEKGRNQSILYQVENIKH
jgi:diguanylate cyclase (GGDEF)-like protein